MDFSDITGFLKSAAPMIASAIGGPLAGGAVTALEGVFGITPDPTSAVDTRLAAVAAAFTGATPDQLLAIKTADNNFQIQMTTLGFKNVSDLEAIAANDRDSARKREETVKDSTPRILAYTLTIGFFSIIAFMLCADVPAGSRDLLNIMLGMLGTSFISVISYFFGSTANSAEKTKLLANSVPATK